MTIFGRGEMAGLALGLVATGAALPPGDPHDTFTAVYTRSTANPASKERYVLTADGNEVAMKSGLRIQGMNARGEFSVSPSGSGKSELGLLPDSRTPYPLNIDGGLSFVPPGARRTDPADRTPQTSRFGVVGEETMESVRSPDGRFRIMTTHRKFGKVIGQTRVDAWKWVDGVAIPAKVSWFESDREKPSGTLTLTSFSWKADRSLLDADRGRYAKTRTPDGAKQATIVRDADGRVIGVEPWIQEFHWWNLIPPALGMAALVAVALYARSLLRASYLRRVPESVPKGAEPVQATRVESPPEERLKER